MRLSQIFTRTARENPAGETSVNAQLLERGGFVYKNSAGIYSYLPLGWQVLQKIAAVIREEMNAIGGQEMFMPAMVEKKYLDATGRWDVPIGFEVRGKTDEKANFVLGWTHEEILTEIAARFVSSYQDLPFAAYQIQNKFRNEPRAKSGLLRGREFMMKDLYSFHADQADLDRYYEAVKGAYHKIFHRCGLKTIYTLAAGGAFTASNTHEFQVIAPVGEDTIFVCAKCDYAENAEISKLKNSGQCSQCGGKIEERKAIEVGNIFPLGTKYSEAFGLYYTDATGNKKLVVMGSYGIGLGRVVATAVEIHHDENGIIWPENIAPFKVHLIALEGGKTEAEKIYKDLIGQDIEVLYDDRNGAGLPAKASQREASAGEKFADADLIGCPIRIVVSKKSLAVGGAEVKRRAASETKIVQLTHLSSFLL